VASLPPANAQSAPPSGKQDVIGQNGRTVTLYVSRGGSRDVMISFNVPQKPEARAGAYNVKVVVETRIIGGAETGPRRKERFSELPPSRL